MSSFGSFADRADAGRRLAGELPPIEGPAVAVGLARGGVPVAAELATAHGFKLDVLAVRKVGHPRQPEFALGAVSEDGVALPPGLPEELLAPQRELAVAAAARLRGGLPPAELAGRTAIVVDDGLATGRSMAVAIETLRRRGPARLIVAVPVAAGPSWAELAAEHEAYAVVVAGVGHFFSVGQFYEVFDQVADDKVVELLRKFSAGGPGRSS